MFQHILLAIDGSGASGWAVEVAASLAVCYNAQVTVLPAFTPTPSQPDKPNIAGAMRKASDESRQLVECTAKRLRELGVAKIDGDTIGGATADAILRVANTREADLIVLGAHGQNRLKSILLGSISITVAVRARCPVLVV